MRRLRRFLVALAVIVGAAVISLAALMWFAEHAPFPIVIGVIIVVSCSAIAWSYVMDCEASDAQEQENT